MPDTAQPVSQRIKGFNGTAGKTFPKTSDSGLESSAGLVQYQIGLDYIEDVGFFP